ncbi:MAG: efflux RND transporter permease subunit, partial [Dehalococcoidia bacterium]
MTWLQRFYTPALTWALRHRLVALLVTGLITLASLGLVFFIPVRLFPSSSPAFLVITLELPTGASVGGTFRELRQIEEVLEGFQTGGLVGHYQAAIGRSQDVFGFPGRKVLGLNYASILVRLGEDLPEDIVQQVRDELPNSEDVSITVTGMRIDSPPESDLEINISGKDIAVLSGLAQALERDLKNVEGILNVDSDLTEARDEVLIRGDPEALARLGLDTGLVGQQVYQHIVGQTITEVDWEGETVDLVVKGRREDTDEINEIKDLAITGPLGNVKLGTVSQITIEQGPVSISHFDGERSVTITGNIITEDTQAVGWRVRSKIAELDVPPGVEVKTLGIFQQIIESFQDIAFAIGVGVVLVYLFLVLSTRSLKNPLVILTSLPLAVVGGLVALSVTGRTISLSSLMGVLTLAGVVVDNAIVLIFFVDELQARGLSMHDALVQGGQSRVRPIVMTALTTTIALVPLATGLSGEGGSIIGAELATVVIGGLISSTFLTLIVVPVVYAMYYETLPRTGNAVKEGTLACCAYCYDRCVALFGKYSTNRAESE